MYAVIRLGNHQYNVVPGTTIAVEKLYGAVGSEVRFTDVLLVADGDTMKMGPDVKSTVVGKVTSQCRDKKLRVFKKKRRKGFSKTIGHRQPYTKVEITRIEA